MSCVKSFFTTLFFFNFLLIFSSEKYIEIKVFDSPTCDSGSPPTRYLLTVNETTNTSYCSEYPFNSFSIFRFWNHSWMDFTSFEGQWCLHSQIHTATYPTSSCVHVSRLYVKFGFLDSLPYSTSSLSDFYVLELFSDKNCEKRWESLTDSTIYGFDSRLYLKAPFGYDYEGSICTPDYIVNVKSNGVYGGLYILKPRSTMKEGECVPYKGGKNSSRLRCLDRSYVQNAFISKIPMDSSHKFRVNYESWDQHCDLQVHPFLTASPYKLGVCSDGRKMVSTNFHFAKLIYENSDCSGDVLFFGTTESEEESMYEKCEWRRTETRTSGEVFQVYKRCTLSNDPYFPNNLGLLGITDFECGNDLTPYYANPLLIMGITYYGDEVCQSENDAGLQYLKIRGSMKSRCVNGHLFVMNWPDSMVCNGIYETFEYGKDGLCIQDVAGVKGTAVVGACIPRYCGGVPEDDPNVCHGQGVCETMNNCTCKNGYKGSECDHYYCHKVRMNDKEVCNGNGECKKPDSCVCYTGYSGEKCETSNWLFFAYVGAPLTSILLVFCVIVTLSFCFILCCCLVLGFFCGIVFIAGCLILIGCSVGVFGALGLTLIQGRSLSKFRRLDNFDLLLNEQLLDKDSSIAHLRINKSLFEIPFDEIEMLTLIGEGGSDAKVYLSLWRGEKVAFKLFKTRMICSTQENFDLFETEVGILANIIHPNIVRFYGASMKPPRVGFLMEYCSNGEILKFVVKYASTDSEVQSMNEKQKEKRNVHYPFKEKIRMCREIASAVEYLHSKNIIHRDIKAENILVDSNEKTKLMDFGFSKMIEDVTAVKTKMVGTNIYIAPEVLTGKYDHKCDVFSFGIFLWIFWCEDEEPYGKDFKGEFSVGNDENYRPDVEKVQKFMMECYPDEEEDQEEFVWIVELMKKCWRADSMKRPNFSEILQTFQNVKLVRKDIIADPMEDVMEDVL